jgi:hypothetical protein
MGSTNSLSKIICLYVIPVVLLSLLAIAACTVIAPGTTSDDDDDTTIIIPDDDDDNDDATNDDDDDDCRDEDADGYGEGEGCLGGDCDDTDEEVWADCDDDGCIDNDGDGYGKGDTCIDTDCDDSDDATWTDCQPTDCTDADGDGYGVGLDCLGADCDDNDDTIWTGCLALDCTDPDGDGYGVGLDCLGTDCDETDDTVWNTCASGTATLTFSLHKDAYVPSGEWLVSGCILGTAQNSIGCPATDEHLIIMLCNTSDTDCQTPELTRLVTAAEVFGEANLLQPYWGGTDLRIENLPAGNWLLMLMIDGYESIDNGAAWTDSFSTTETAWGGIASDGDLLLGAPDDGPSLSYNPDPAPWPITLIDGQTTDLDNPLETRSQMYDDYGSVWMSHYHLH